MEKLSNWLNSTFNNFDSAFFNFTHALNVNAGGFFTPFFKFITFFGNGGWLFIALGVILMLFKKTRRYGLCMLIALGIGALLTNIIIKKSVARPRPFTTEQFKPFWIKAGSTKVSEYSFPSGHTTSAMAAMTALFLCLNKKWSWLFFILALIMGLSRIYLVVHYATDVIGGLIVGGISAVIGYFVVKYIYKYINKNLDKPFCKFIINADIKDLFSKN